MDIDIMIQEDHSFVIGVTGHRELPEERIPEIMQEVKDFYADMRREYGGTITVVSPLAEGADTLCAKLALDMGFRLVALLPMGALEYRRDFSGDAAAEFDCLLSMADEVMIADMADETDSIPPSRGACYRAAGIQVAKTCDVLLAIWDGIEKNTPDGAGTWETIRLARGTGKPVHYVMV